MPGLPIQLIVGLGNPGREYEATRHNAGFWWVENLAEEQRVPWKSESRFHGRVGRLSGGGSYNVLPLNGRVGQSSIWMYGELDTIDFIIETGEEYFAAPEDIPQRIPSLSYPNC